MAYVISFMSAKGGVAKTSSTIEIAALFKKKGFKTLAALLVHLFLPL